MQFALMLSVTKDNWPKNTQEVIGITKEMFCFFANVKVKSMEEYGQCFKAELSSTIGSATEVDKESPTVAT